MRGVGGLRGAGGGSGFGCSFSLSSWDEVAFLVLFLGLVRLGLQGAGWPLVGWTFSRDKNRSSITS